MFENHPERTFTLGPVGDREVECKKEIAELAAEISTFSKVIARINNLSPLVSCEILSELINMEDLLNEAYTSYLQSSITKFVADEFSKLFPVLFRHIDILNSYVVVPSVRIGNEEARGNPPQEFDRDMFRQSYLHG